MMAASVRQLWLLPFLTFGFLILGCAPTGEKAQEPDREVALAELERIDGQLFVRGETAPFTGWMLEYYEGGEVKSRSAIEAGRLNGLSEGWYPDGQLQVREMYRDGVAHGTRTRWYRDGGMESEAEIVAGELHGVLRRWHPNGVLAEKTEMKEGEASGVSMGFFPSGYVRARVLLENGDPVEQKFWEDGDVREDELAENRTGSI